MKKNSFNLTDVLTIVFIAGTLLFASPVFAGEATVSFNTPVVVSSLPDDVIVHQSFSAATAVAGELSTSLQVLVDGVWEYHLGPFTMGFTYAGWSSSGIGKTDPGEITLPGFYRSIITFSPDGGGAEEVFEGPSFEIVDPVDIPSFDPATGVLDLPSVEITNNGVIETFAVKIKFNSDGSFEIISCVLTN